MWSGTGSQDRADHCRKLSEPHSGQWSKAAAVSLIASLATSSASLAGTTGFTPPRDTGRPRGAELKPEIGFRTADLGTRQV